MEPKLMGKKMKFPYNPYSTYFLLKPDLFTYIPALTEKSHKTVYNKEC